MKYLLIIISIVLLSCKENIPGVSTPGKKTAPMEIADFYKAISTQVTYSTSVQDSFKISVVVPSRHDKDSTSTYPLILVLDANAYFEPVATELKLGMLTQGYPPSIIVGIGYKGFWAMDSLRNRDYTFPTAPAADSFRVSGGGLKFKEFINQELLPSLNNQYRIDPSKVVLMGHSLGGYFVLYYLFDAVEKGENKITNFVAASPSLWYSNGYLFDQEKKHHQTPIHSPINLFVGTGSLERQPEEKETDFDRLKTRFTNRKDTTIKYSFVELGNFSHMDAAIPGLMKGLSFVLVDE